MSVIEVREERTVELGNNKLFMKRKDPYGYIYLSLERGALPREFAEAAFTGWRDADAAVAKYVASRSAQKAA